VTTAERPEAELAPYTAARLGSIVDTALRDAGALGVLPTPLDAVRAAAGIELVEDAALRDGVLGAFSFERRTIHVNPSQSPHRRRFTEAHEIAHALCPWHHAALREDTEAELFGPARDAIEAEANAGAALLIFQGSAFADHAARQPCTLDGVRALAAAHGASLHATLHHFAQSNREPVAMLVVGRFPGRDGVLPVWRGVESPAYRARAGRAVALAPDGVRPGTPLHRLVERARVGDVAPEPGPAGARAEAAYNRHSFLVLVSFEDAEQAIAA
jgi:hypothetical protein